MSADHNAIHDDEKACPRCAETVKAAARVCRFCNYEFGAPIQSSSTPTPPQQPASAAPKKRHPILRAFAWVFGVLIVLGVIGSLIGPSSNTSPNNTTSDSTSDATQEDSGSTDQALQVTALDLARAYNANEVAAQNAYGDKTLEVTGTVTGVTLDLFSNPTLQMAGVNEFLPVQATFDKSDGDKLSRIAKGDQVTIRCTSITEVISAPMLSDCSLP